MHPLVDEVSYSSWIKKADSRPLYEYHATSDEYADLKRLLREIGQPEKLKNDKGYAACFTLFAPNGIAGTTGATANGAGILFMQP